MAPERFALLQALLAFLLERCGDEASATVASADIRERFHLTQQELEEHLDLLNLVNFGGGCYAVYCSTENGSIMVDKELYGDTFRRPARLSPLEAKALLRALDVVAPLVAAEAHTLARRPCATRSPARSAHYTLRDTPSPSPAGGEESAVTVLNEGVRDRRVVADRLPLAVEQRVLGARRSSRYLLRRDERGWYVEAWDRSKDGRRTFKVAVRARRRAARSDATSRDRRWTTCQPAWAARPAPPACCSRPAVPSASSSSGPPARRPATAAPWPRSATARCDWLVSEMLRTAATPRCSPRRRCARAVREQALELLHAVQRRPRSLTLASATRAFRCSMAAVAVGDVQPAVAVGQRLRV